MIKEWLKEICRWNRDDWFVKIIEDTLELEDEGKFKCNIYTHDYKYRITVIIHKGRANYLGCTVSTRKSRAGEDWIRGNDLPDGPYTYETWQEIKDAILANELVKIVRPKKIVVDHGKNRLDPHPELRVGMSGVKQGILNQNI